MKKFIYLILSAFLLLGCVKEDDAFRFKKEYESLNGKENDKGRDYVNIQIPDENPMVYADLDTILKVIETEGIIYFGFDECPWCRNALPVLIEAANEKEVEKIYYYDIKDIRDTLTLNEDGTVFEYMDESKYVDSVAFLDTLSSATFETLTPWAMNAPESNNTHLLTYSQGSPYAVTNPVLDMMSDDDQETKEAATHMSCCLDDKYTVNEKY